MTEDDERLSEESAIVNDNMSAEERDILDRFERDELRPAPGVEREVCAPLPALNARLRKPARRLALAAFLLRPSEQIY